MQDKTRGMSLPILLVISVNTLTVFAPKLRQNPRKEVPSSFRERIEPVILQPQGPFRDEAVQESQDLTPAMKP